MLISAGNLAHYLLGRGLLAPAAIVDGDLAIVDLSRRNRNFKVSCGSAGLFVKQARLDDPQVGPQATATLATESATCDLLAADPATAQVSARRLGFDAARSVLILDLVDGEEVGLFHRRTSQLPPEIAEAIGRALATIHGHTASLAANRPRGADDPRMAPHFSGRMPWTLSFTQFDPTYLQSLSAGNRQLFQLIRQFPEFDAALASLRGQWHINALTHGDMKWDNCIVSFNAGAAHPRVTIVDWELADYGDACWDAGAILQAYLAAWILSMPLAGSAEQMIRLAQYPLAMVQQAIRGFWDAYASAMGMPKAQSDQWLLRAIGYAAVRLIQTAYEHLQGAQQMSPSVMCLLQVSMNMLIRPAHAARELLALDVSGTERW